MPAAAPQARPSTRREEIVEIAKGLLADKGYAATSTRDIAEACGLLPGSLYSHFRSKAQILEMIVGPFFEQMIAEQREAVAGDAPGAQRLDAMIRRVVALCSDHAAEIRILHYDWPHIADAEGLEALVGQSNQILDLWLQVLADGAADGSLRPTLQPETAVRAITATIQAVLDRQRFGTRADLAAQFGLAALTDEVVDQLTRGLRA
jgi:TetR/AcrR family transcriptional regulator, cholesterol catabolism regulator